MSEFRHGKFGEPTAIYRYNGHMAVCRYEFEGKKQILPWMIVDGYWHAKSADKPRPLYNLEALRDDSAIIIVEGEKCVEHIKALQTERVPICWPGGAQAVKYADWEPIRGRDVWLFPDHDEPGDECMLWLGNHLTQMQCQVQYVDHSRDTLPNGWDIADTDWSWAGIAEWIKAHLRPFIDVSWDAVARSREPGEDDEDLRETNRRENFDPSVVAKPKGPSILSMDAALVAPSEGREWLFEEILPVGAFLIVGRPKVGKSWLLLQLAIAATTCRDFLGFQALGAFATLYIGAEDDITRIKARFLRFGIEPAPSNLFVIVRNGLESLIAEHAESMTFEQWLDSYLEANPHIKLVILDTESTIRHMWNGEHRGAGHDVKSITRKDYAEARDMDRIGLNRSVFIGLVNHTAKRKGSGQWADIHELINRTNTALAGASGSIVIADPPDHDPMDSESRHRVLGIRGRDINSEYLIALEQTKSGAFESLGKWSLFTQTQAETEIWDAAIEITEEMQCERYITARDIAEEIGKKHQTVKRAITRMAKNNFNLVYKGYRMDVKKGEGLRLTRIA